MKSNKGQLNVQNDYNLGVRIGKGSFGKVYKAVNKSSGKVVAIKIINMEECEAEIEEFFKEISFLATCYSKYITQYYTSCIVGTDLWIVMEYMGGGSVLDLLDMGPLPESSCQIILRDVLYGLNYLHANNKIHRDIKCANILLSDHGQVKLADFGVAGELSKSGEKRNTFVGTPFWMAPEVIRQQDYFSAVDIWSVGIVGIEMADTKPPYMEHNAMRAMLKIANQDPPCPMNQSISKAFREFIEACLTKDPNLRPDASVLLKCQFLKKAKKNHFLEPLIQTYQHFRQTTQGSETVDDEPIDAPESSDNSAPQWLFETIRIADKQLVTAMINDPSTPRDAPATKSQKGSPKVKKEKPKPIIPQITIPPEPSLSTESAQEEDAPRSDKELFVAVLDRLLLLHPTCSEQVTGLKTLISGGNASALSTALNKHIEKLLSCPQ